MLQRIQTIFLLVITLIHLSLFFVPSLFWMELSPNGLVTLKLTALTEKFHFMGGLISTPTYFPWPLFLTNLLAMGLSIFIVFQYKKRKQQIQLCRFLMIVLVAQYAVLAYYLFKIEKPLVFVPAKSIGMIFPLISLILCWLAARNIRKDEELVRSVDRIR